MGGESWIGGGGGEGKGGCLDGQPRRDLSRQQPIILLQNRIKAETHCLGWRRYITQAGGMKRDRLVVHSTRENLTVKMKYMVICFTKQMNRAVKDDSVRWC